MRIGFNRESKPAVYAGRPRPVLMHQRERPRVVHHAAHIDREAEYERQAKHFEFDPLKALNNSYLDAPPSRPGFVQRWVTDGTRETADATAQRNWFIKRKQGWQPRDPSTIPPELRDIYPSTRLQSGQDVIRVATNILCELPIQVARARGMAIRDLINRQKQSIPESTDELRKRGREGVGDLKVVDNETVRRGTNPELRGRGLPMQQGY